MLQFAFWMCLPFQKLCEAVCISQVPCWAFVKVLGM